MAKTEKPEFRLKRVYSDGNSGEPELFELKDINGDWTMGRREFLITSAVGMTLLGGSYSYAKEEIKSKSGTTGF